MDEETAVFLGHAPEGRLCVPDVKVWGLSLGLSTAVTDYGLVVGKIPPYTDHVVGRADGTQSIVPVGVTHSTLIKCHTTGVFISANIALFTNKDVIAIKTSDTAATYGGPVFVSSLGMATQTVDYGWKIGICRSYEVGLNGIGYGAHRMNQSYLIVELQDVVYIEEVVDVPTTPDGGA